MFHVYVVSDATGQTAQGVMRAALTQFDASRVEIHRFGGVRTDAQVRSVVGQASETGGFIVHTLVSAELRRTVLTEGRAANVPTIDLMGPLLARLSDLLATKPRAEPGLFQPFDTAYLQRIEAIDFTVRHDDGRNIQDLEKAEIVLVGVSRTSKTPLSIYLSYRGWKVANIPLALGVEPPARLFELPRRRVVGLIVRPERLAELRRVRLEHIGTSLKGYADLDYISQGEFKKPVASGRIVTKSEIEPNTFFKADDVWRITYEGSALQLTEVKGFYDIQKLLANPDQCWHCAELMGSVLQSTGETVIDEKARKAYQKELKELQQEMEMAESINDYASLGNLQLKYDQLVEHLTQSLGLKGRARQVGNPIEKARSAVTWRIRSAIAKIEMAHPALGKHLANSIKTGTVCKYSPEQAINWVTV